MSPHRDIRSPKLQGSQTIFERSARSSGASSHRVPAGRPDSGPLESGPQSTRRAIQAQGAAPGLLRCNLRRPCGRGGDRRRRAGRGRARPGAEEAATSAESWGRDVGKGENRTPGRPNLDLGPRSPPRSQDPVQPSRRRVRNPTHPALPSRNGSCSGFSGPEIFRFQSGIAPKEKITSGGPRGRGRCVCKELIRSSCCLEWSNKIQGILPHRVQQAEVILISKDKGSRQTT